MASRIAIIVAGRIGDVLCRQARERGWDIAFILTSRGIWKDAHKKIDEAHNFQKYCDGLDAVCLAIPTRDDGKVAYDYMKTFLTRGIPVVTCEKGALANYFPELFPYSVKLRWTASVGGGTQLLRYVEGRNKNDIVEIHAIINGTLNYVLDRISLGVSMEVAIHEARGLGYVEPCAKTTLDVVNKESTQDVPMKAAILFNTVGFDRPIRARSMYIYPLSMQELESVAHRAQTTRFIVSIFKGRVVDRADGGFYHKQDEWVISGGFRQLDAHPLFSRLVTSGVINTLLVHERSGGTYAVSGPGAGPQATVSSMIRDLEEFLT